MCGRPSLASLGFRLHVAVRRGFTLSAPFGAAQHRHYTPPSRRTWSKQHYRIRTPRPLVDRFDLSWEHPEKEWWRQRRVAPATFFGFPDVSKHSLRGGHLYIEQMDSVTLAVISDKCVKDGVVDTDIWDKFSWRAQQIASRTHEPDLCYIFRSFARMDWFDQNLLTTYLGRLHRRLHAFQLPDVAVLLEAFANPRFRLSAYLNKALTHLMLLLQHRDDAKVEDLARACSALRGLHPLDAELVPEVLGTLELLAEALLQRDLTEIGAGRAIHVLDCYVTWGLVGRDLSTARSSASSSADLCWTLVRDLKGQLRAHGREEPDDLAVLAEALASGGLAHPDLWAELAKNLEHEAYRLTGPSCARAAYAAALASQRQSKLYAALARRLAEQRSELSPLDCAKAASGFLRGPRDVAERVVLRGPVVDRALELGLNVFDGKSAALMLDALSRARRGAWGVEALAGGLLEAIAPRLSELSAADLAGVVRALGSLRPASELLVDVLDAAQNAALAEGAALGAHQVATLCQGIAAQLDAACESPRRLQALLPAISSALEPSPPKHATAALLLGSLARCPAAPERNAVLDICARRLVNGASELSAFGLVTLSESLAAYASACQDGASWMPPDELLKAVAGTLNIKRYDLNDGILWRAARALKTCGCSPELRLEKRDQLAESA